MKKRRRIDWNSRDDFQPVEDGVWDWVAQPVPVPTTGICDFPCKCVKINNDWLRIIIPAILRAGHADVWEGTEAEKERAYNEVNSLIGMLMACDCGKETTSAHTNIIVNRTDIDRSIDQAIARYETYAPDTPETIGRGEANPSTASDEILTDRALCMILHAIVDTFRSIFREASAIVTEEDKSATRFALGIQKVARDAEMILASAAGIGAIDYIVQRTWIETFGDGPLVHAVRFLEGTETVVTETDLGNQWVEDMTCYLYSNLRGSDLEFDTWRGAAGNRGNVLPFFDAALENDQHREAAIQAWNGYINDLASYYAFMEMIDDAVAGGDNADEWNCPCCINQASSTLPEAFFNWDTVPAGWTYDNPFRNIPTFGVVVGSTGGGNPIVEFPLGFINFRFSGPIRVQRIRLGMCRPSSWGAGGNYGVHVSTECFEDLTDSWNEIAGFCDNGLQVDVPFPGPGGGLGAHETRYIFVRKDTAVNVPPLRVWGMWLRYEIIT